MSLRLFNDDIFGRMHTDFSDVFNMGSSMFGSMMPFGDNFFSSNPFSMMSSMHTVFDDMRRMMANQSNNPNVESFQSTTVMSFGSGGQPKVYQASSHERRGANGAREIRKSVRDSERGIERVHVGHHIGDRAHIIERERDGYNGEIVENVQLENMDEDETELFNREFEERMKRSSRYARRYSPLKLTAPGYGDSHLMAIEGRRPGRDSKRRGERRERRQKLRR